jgi:hypothetical protein
LQVERTGCKTNGEWMGWDLQKVIPQGIGEGQKASDFASDDPDTIEAQPALWVVEWDTAEESEAGANLNLNSAKMYHLTSAWQGGDFIAADSDSVHGPMLLTEQIPGGWWWLQW